MEKEFTVVAGKYDGYDRDCKYCESFDTLDEAISAYDKLNVYPWAEISYKGRRLQIY